MHCSRLVVVALVVLLVATAGCLDAPVGGQSPSSPATGTATEAAPASTGSDSPPRYSELYRETIPSVVMLQVSSPGGPVTGSGFVYDRRGHVVTNEHVVGPAETVEVRFHDGRWRTATVVGTDPYTDLAVVRVRDAPADATPLPVASSPPRPGERVVALGSPYGLEGSITSGIVSGVNRSMPTENGFSIPDTVQTDAAINPGNSGGPLVSRSGRVVGVNRAGGGENIGFAVSAAVVERVVPSLVEDGRYAHAYVGVRTVDVTPAIAGANDLGETRGLLVVDTVAGGPAEGVLRPSRDQATVDGRAVPTGGDVIVAVDGRPVADHQGLSRYLTLGTRPGETLDVTVVRNGSRRTVSLELESRPPP